MIDRRASLRLILLAAPALGLAACGGAGGSGGEPGGTVLGVLRKNGLRRFARAIEAAGLTETLSGAGPFTVFAPTDRAMAAARLPKDGDRLREIVAYHIVEGMYSTDFLSGVDVNYTTLEGSMLAVHGSGGVVTVGGAAIVDPDLGADNGIVNVIDRVLMPG